MQFVCKFALENARNSVGGPPDPPSLLKLSMITKSFIIIITLQRPVVQKPISLALG
jgi:hypothetical protein